ncbi:Retrotransposon-like protein 1 [Dictyocoela muelleri]|nr:Retrotransposon-like protein 1 [Dictyocoela muelleri]
MFTWSLNENSVPKKYDIQNIIGLINWYRPFLENISMKCNLLSKKFKKGEKFSWNNEDQLKLENILKEIQKQTIFYFPDHNLAFILETDASDVGFGSILRRGNNIVGFYSHKLTVSEQNYTFIKKRNHEYYKIT